MHPSGEKREREDNTSEYPERDPFPDIRDINPDVPPELAVMIRRMCVKERDRRIPTPAALLAEFRRLGYDTAPAGRAASVSYTQSSETAQTLTSMKSVLANLPERQNDTLSFETDDVEIKAFVEKLKSRKRRKRIALCILAAASALALLSFFLLVIP